MWKGSQPNFWGFEIAGDATGAGRAWPVPGFRLVETALATASAVVGGSVRPEFWPAARHRNRMRGGESPESPTAYCPDSPQRRILGVRSLRTVRPVFNCFKIIEVCRWPSPRPKKNRSAFAAAVITRCPRWGTGRKNGGRARCATSAGKTKSSQPPIASRARLNTSSSIGSVSRPVNVFCWLG